ARPDGRLPPSRGGLSDPGRSAYEMNVRSFEAIDPRGRTASMAREYRIVSADSHTLEPPDLWTEWLDKKFQDKAPKLVEDKDGGHGWLYMGATTPEPLGLVTCVGTRPEDLKWTGARYGKPTNPAAREIHEGCYRGPGRLAIMDEDGVDAEILYPPQRAMLTFMKNQDKEAHLAG